MAYPTCRVGRRSMALRLPLVFCVARGVTSRCRGSAQQAQPSRLAHHLIEEPLGNLMLEQPSAVLGEHRGVKAGLQQAHIQKPTEQEVVIEFLAEGALAADRVQRNQQRRLEQSFGWN